MKMHGGSKGIHPHVGMLNLCTGRMQVPSFLFWPPCVNVKALRYQLNVRLCVSQDEYKCDNGNKMSLTLKKT
jgi:hypothetical protein